jgi:anti-sigma28 factor (negative regulator of flagellin synthesis)
MANSLRRKIGMRFETWTLRNPTNNHKQSGSSHERVSEEKIEQIRQAI